MQNAGMVVTSILSKSITVYKNQLLISFPGTLYSIDIDQPLDIWISCKGISHYLYLILVFPNAH